MTIDEFRDLVASTKAEIGKAVLGQSDLIDLLLISLFARGHCLLEGPPGTAKTLLAQSLSAAIDLHFGRIQFTPDLMPGDVLGVNIFDFKSSTFTLTKGPVFTDILLADEINRAPPKTQSALLQAMNERVVTIDGTTYPLGNNFTVVATQNPIEQQGTYPLPEAQLDRFLFKLQVDFPSETDELAILTKHSYEPLDFATRKADVGVVMSADALAAGRGLIDDIRLDATILEYIVALVRATRNDAELLYGVSTRGADALASAVRAKAALDARTYAIPDDVQALFLPAMRHRVGLAPAAEIDGRNADDVLTNILNKVHAPR